MEVLTDEGWKHLFDVRGDEQALQLEADVAMWGPILEIVEVPFRGWVNEHDGPNARLAFAVTDDHQFVAGRMTYGKPDKALCRYCDAQVGLKGIWAHEGKHERNGDARLRAERQPVGEFRRSWRLVAYSELPREFFVRRTNEWAGTSQDRVVFEPPMIEAVLCGVCGERIYGPSQQERERARDGRGAYHRGCRTVACQATVSCSVCGDTFNIPRAQARRSKRFFCPGGNCRTGSSPRIDPESTIVIPQTGPMLAQVPHRLHRRYEFDFMDWAAFLGWFVSEGSTTPRGRSWLINIAQERRLGAKYEAIGELLDRMGIPATRTAHGFNFNSQTIGIWLRDNCGIGSHHKRIPHTIKESSPEAIRAFLDAYRMGDGSRHTHLESARYITSSKGLADDLHEVLVKLGRARKMRPQHPEGSVGVNSHGRAFLRRAQTWVVTEAGRPSDSNVRKKNVIRSWHEGPARRLRTPTETLMIRRNGTPYWSGCGLFLP